MKKFEFTDEFITDTFGNNLFRIKALVDFGTIRAGELGGFAEKEENLSNNDKCVGLRRCVGFRQCRLCRR